MDGKDRRPSERTGYVDHSAVGCASGAQLAVQESGAGIRCRSRECVVTTEELAKIVLSWRGLWVSEAQTLSSPKLNCGGRSGSWSGRCQLAGAITFKHPV